MDRKGRISPEWLLGFIEGEGSFGIRQSLKSTARMGINFSPAFSISLTKCDTPTLKEVMAFLGYGSICYHSNERYRVMGRRWRDVTTLSIIGVKHSIKLRQILVGLNWHTHKVNDFNAWCEAIDIISKKEHLTIKGVEKICDLRDKINCTGEPNHQRWYNYLTKEKIMEIVTHRPKKYCRRCKKEIPLEGGQKNYCTVHCRNMRHLEQLNLEYKMEKVARGDDFKICKICGNKFYRKEVLMFKGRMICPSPLCSKERRRSYYNTNSNKIDARKKKFAELKVKVVALHSQGLSVRKICSEVGVGRQTCYNWLRKRVEDNVKRI